MTLFQIKNLELFSALPWGQGGGVGGGGYVHSQTLSVSNVLRVTEMLRVNIAANLK